jgi:hypothetical protein
MPPAESELARRQPSQSQYDTFAATSAASDGMPQRRWGSLDDALAVGEISSRTLEHALATPSVVGGEPIDAVEGRS